MDEYGRIRRAHRDGMSIREIAREFHHSRYKVREVLRGGGEPKSAQLLRSDTLTQHQSDPRRRSNLIPTRCQKDDTNRVDFAARTAWVEVTCAQAVTGSADF